MVDPVVTSLSQSGLSQMEGLLESGRGPGPAVPADVERFSAAVEQDMQGVGSLDPTSNNSIQPVSVATTTDGDLMRGIDTISATSTKMHADVVQSLSNSGEMGDMFRLQFQVANLTTTQTIVGQTGQKGSQGVQTLLKGQ